MEAEEQEGGDEEPRHAVVGSAERVALHILSDMLNHLLQGRVFSFTGENIQALQQRHTRPNQGCQLMGKDHQFFIAHASPVPPGAPAGQMATEIEYPFSFFLQTGYQDVLPAKKLQSLTGSSSHYFPVDSLSIQIFGTIFKSRHFELLLTFSVEDQEGSQ